MRAAVYICGMGNIHFYNVLYGTLDLPSDVSVLYCMDQSSMRHHPQGHSSAQLCFQTLRDGVVVLHDYGAAGSINAMWNGCMRHASMHSIDIAVVLNDDVAFSRGGEWFTRIRAVLEKNDHIGMVGIPADGAWHEQNQARLRWFTDPWLFDDPHVFGSAQEWKYEPWTSGFCWAAKVEPWMDTVHPIPYRYHHGYGEPYMGLRMGREYKVLSIYYPLCFHYGGGGYWGVHGHPVMDAAFNEKAGSDAEEFARDFGTSELDDLYREWLSDNDISQFPPVSL